MCCRSRIDHHKSLNIQLYYQNGTKIEGVRSCESKNEEMSTEWKKRYSISAFEPEKMSTGMMLNSPDDDEQRFPSKRRSDGASSRADGRKASAA